MPPLCAIKAWAHNSWLAGSSWGCKQRMAWADGAKQATQFLRSAAALLPRCVACCAAGHAAPAYVHDPGTRI